MPIDAINFHEQAIRDKNSTPVLLIRDRTNGKIYQADAEPGTGLQKVQLYVWDPVGMVPVRMTQPTINIDGDLDVTISDVEALLADRYFQRSKNYYDSKGNLTYKCRNYDVDALETDTDWLVWKLVYDTKSNLTDKEGPRTGAVDSEPSGLAWNI